MSDVALVAKFVVTVPMATLKLFSLRVREWATLIKLFPVATHERQGMTGELIRPSETPTTCLEARVCTSGIIREYTRHVLRRYFLTRVSNLL